MIPVSPTPKAVSVPTCFGELQPVPPVMHRKLDGCRTRSPDRITRKGTLWRTHIRVYVRVAENFGAVAVLPNMADYVS